MTAATIDLDLTGIDLETLAELHPRARCTPRLGGQRVLPTKSVPTSGLMRWKWAPTFRPIMLDGALIQIGDRCWQCGVGGPGEAPAAGPITVPSGGLELWARLHDFE